MFAQLIARLDLSIDLDDDSVPLLIVVTIALSAHACLLHATDVSILPRRVFALLMLGLLLEVVAVVFAVVNDHVSLLLEVTGIALIQTSLSMVYAILSDNAWRFKDLSSRIQGQGHYEMADADWLPCVREPRSCSHGR